GDGGTLPRYSNRQIAVHVNDAGNSAFAARRLYANAIAWAHLAAGDHAAETAEVQVRTQHPLYRHAEGLQLCLGGIHLTGFEEMQQRRAVVPLHLGTGLDDVVAAQRRQRYRRDIIQTDLFGEVQIVSFDATEAHFRVVDQVHLVDGQHD